MIRVVIVDDHMQVREAWKLLLNRDDRLTVVACCENGEEAITTCREQEPDVVLMDINMEPVNGIDATRSIRSFSSSVKIIGISVHTDLTYITRMLDAGANGYVTKNSSSEEMITAIFAVIDGEKFLCREIADLSKNLT